MATKDITRAAFSAAKRYSGLSMQQGRVLTDDDYNEGAQIAAESRRLGRLQIIGPHGSADDGFRVEGPQIGQNLQGIDRIEFTIREGNYFLGGHHLRLPQPETFNQQADWLTHVDLAPPAADRIDLVYLDVWEQAVSAIEDEELVEVALGGPDTAVRERPIARVSVAPDVGTEECLEAWVRVTTNWANSQLGVVDAEMRLAPDTRLVVTYDNAGVSEDLCAPDVMGGYLGAENQAIRVMLTGPNAFTWGFDNAAPLYRVEVVDAQTLRLLTAPRDELHAPRQGQVVELLPWGAVLDNGEKLAEEGLVGHLAHVDGGLDGEGLFTLTGPTALPPNFGEAWQSRADEAALRTSHYGSRPVTPFLYMRIWDRGADPNPALTLPLGPGPQGLGTTGMQVSFLGNDRVPGDHWIVAARPETPDQVVPWRLEHAAGREPHGYRRYRSPLALIRWVNDNGAMVAEVIEDCRPRFRPLTRSQTCCTYTVGDGDRSHGDYASIQAAIDSLPAWGGEICILPGNYEEQMLLQDRRNIVIHGCGRHSVLRAPPGGIGPIFALQRGVGIKLSDLTFDVPTATAVHGTGLSANDRNVRPQLQDIRLINLHITGRDESAIYLEFAERVEIRGCEIRMNVADQAAGVLNPAAQQASVFVAGDDLRVENNKILVQEDERRLRALGGLQIGGGSERVLVESNEIVGGNGAGILLGHILRVKLDDIVEPINYINVATSPMVWLGGYITFDENGCIVFEPPEGGGDPNDPTILMSGGDLQDVVIIDNRIVGAGLSGIATAIAFQQLLPVSVRITRLTIDRNTIQGCAQLEVPSLTPLFRAFLAFGGIAIIESELTRISNNRIEGNGRNAVSPTVGMFLGSVQTAEIANNQVIDNGVRDVENAPPRDGTRGGIVIMLARPQVSGLSSAAGNVKKASLGALPALRQLAMPAVHIADNVVQQPMGKALVVIGTGAMHISGNHFASQGTPTQNFWQTVLELLPAAGQGSVMFVLMLMVEKFLGTSVTVVSLGASSEMMDILSFYKTYTWASTGLYRHDVQASEFIQYNEREEGLGRYHGRGTNILLGNGEILFNSNRVVQDFFDGTPSFTLSSAFLATLDDLVADDNSFCVRCDRKSDAVVADVLGFAWSTRFNSNRCEETIARTLLSAATFGLMYNTTVHNQGTHCFMVEGPAAMTVDGPNRSLVELIFPLACSRCIEAPFRGLMMYRNNSDRRVDDMMVIAGRQGVVVNPNLVIGVGAPINSISFTVVAAGNTSVQFKPGTVDGEIAIQDEQLAAGQARTIEVTANDFDRVEIQALKATPVIVSVVCRSARKPSFPVGGAGSLGVGTKVFGVALDE